MDEKSLYKITRELTSYAITNHNEDFAMFVDFTDSGAAKVRFYEPGNDTMQEMSDNSK